VKIISSAPMAQRVPSVWWIVPRTAVSSMI
jgi:hypothetical protein